MGIRIDDEYGGGEELKIFGEADFIESHMSSFLPPSIPTSSISSTSASVLVVPSSESVIDPVKDEEVDEFDWVAVERIREADVIMTEQPPEIDEVEDAFSALQLIFNNDDDDKSEDQVSDLELVDWLEPPLQFCNTRFLQPYMLDRLYDAFHLSQTDASVQRMVMSLASDRAVWDAVMNNEVVRELITNAERSEEDETGSAGNFIRKLFERSATKIIDAMERVTKYVTDLFNVVVPGDETVVLATGAAPVMEKLQMTVLLAVVVLLIVLVTRGTRGR